MREKDYAEVVFPSLQANCGQVPDVFFRNDPFEIFELAARQCRQRLRHLGHVAESEEATAAIGEFYDVLARARLFELLNNFRRESALDGRQNSTPLFGDADDRPASGQRIDQ